MKYECEGQISLFDSIVESSVKTVDDYAEEALDWLQSETEG